MAGLFCCKSRVLKVHAGQPSRYSVVTEESFLTSNSLQVMVCTAGGCAAGVMPFPVYRTQNKSPASHPADG